MTCFLTDEGPAPEFHQGWESRYSNGTGIRRVALGPKATLAPSGGRTGRRPDPSVVRAAAEARTPRPTFDDFRYVPYREATGTALRDLRRQLEQLDLAQQRRVAFYPIGGAWALLLDETRGDWKPAYIEHPFQLPDLSSNSR